MHRTLPALIILTLAACSSSSNSSGTTASGSGPGGSTGGRTSGSASAGTSSGGTQGTTTGGSGPVTVENFNALLNQAICTFIASCDSPDAPYYISAICPTQQELDFSNLPLAVDAGRVFFDPAQAAACLAGLNAGVCSIMQILPCIPFLDDGYEAIGLVPPAGPCYADEDCLSGSCVGNDLTNCTAGTCAGLVASGGACACANCGICDPDAGLTCVMPADTCAAAAQVGQGCGTGDPACADNLICADDVCASLPIPAGNACTQSSGECTSGHYCFEKDGGVSGNCADLVAAGQPCGEDADHHANAFVEIDNECAGTHPVCLGAGSMADSSVVPGVCAQYSDVGGPCTPAGPSVDAVHFPYNNGCYQYLNCVAGACAKPPGSGKACSNDGTPCDPTTTYCAAATTTCTPFIAVGGTCTGTDTGECGPAAVCNSNSICQGSEPSCSPTL